MKPLIGITAEINPATNMCEANHEYALAVAAAGGTPVMLAPLSDSPSYIEDVLASLDGVLLSGGGDLSPYAYGETLKHPSVLSVNEQRDYFELQLARRAFVLNMPTLGICRGSQIMNVALGGTLYQDLTLIVGVTDEQARLHQQPKPYERGRHEVSISPKSILHAAYREEHAEQSDEPLLLFVNSMHHQSIRDTAPLLETVATCGPVIEATESHTSTFYVGVQWHPEYLGNATPLFRAFLNAARA